MKPRTIHPIAQVNAKINRSPPNATLANAIGLPSIPSFRALIIQPIIQMTAINFVIRRAPSNTLITIAYSLACKFVHISGARCCIRMPLSNKLITVFGKCFTVAKPQMSKVAW